jgi:hypothetical protein
MVAPLLQRAATDRGDADRRRAIGIEAKLVPLNTIAV